MRLILVVGLISSCLCLYEDQIGKFDWRKQFIGCPRQAFFHKLDKTEQLIVSTQENVLASLSTATGDIIWRKIQEENPKASQIMAQAGSKRLYTISDGGQIVRAWNEVNGALIWQKSICEIQSNGPQLAVPRDATQGIYILSCGTVHHLTSSGEYISKTNIGESGWNRMSVFENEVRVVTLDQDSVTVRVIVGGKVANTKVAKIKESAEKCVFTGNFIACFHSDEVQFADISSSGLTVNVKNIGQSTRELFVLDSDHIAARSSSATTIINLKQSNEVLKINSDVDAIAMTSDNKVVTQRGNSLSVFNLANGKELIAKTIPNEVTVSAKNIFANGQKDSLELFVIYADCRTEFIVISLARNTLELEWVKEEGLARVSAVEMVDLPLSESQQLIEDEFDENNGNIISAFVHRTIAQLIQFQRWLVHSIQEVMTISESVMSKGSFSQILNTVKSSSHQPSGRSLERDYFNLRKMMVVVSLDGVIFGIDTADGVIVWRKNLGAGFTPLKNSLGELKIPLFLQRSTSNYHLQGQAAVVFKDSFSDQGVLFVFNPITGTVIERKNLGSSVSRVDMLPFAGKDQIHSLVLIDKNDKVSFYPDLPRDFKPAHPVFILTNSGSILTGKNVNFESNTLDSLWNANIHLNADEKIISIKGKQANQRVHSQGRVLIDRNVQYKYSNPNLVAVATLDSSSQVFSIYLIDVVSGLIVHTAKLTKASSPIHMVHCENWVAYSYWSEKSRRTELGVIELYEGELQNNKERFDSLSPTSKAPEVTTQSYVYAQGIDAMAVSETEQGLTTRSIILALPFGGLHEVSRKLLDANRPQELTQEMREEGMIPYMPEILIATEEMVNYNQTIYRVKGIKTSPSGLESTSLMLAYGIDLFFTRLHPSGTFDILKDDFDHVLISVVLIGLFVGSFISKRIARNNALKASWA